MKQYYLHDGKDQKGPLSLEELLKSGVTSDTRVWHSGLEAWIPAQELEELKPLFHRQGPPPLHTTPPPYANPNMGQVPIHKTDTSNSGSKSIFKGIFVIIGILFIAFIGFIVYNKHKTGDSSPIEYHESKMTVLEYERSHPSEFLEAQGTYNETLFGNKIKIHGTVNNKATVANFKDIMIQISYFSVTRTLINQEQRILYDFVPAKTIKSFEWKITPPGGTSTMGWNAVGAKAY